MLRAEGPGPVSIVFHFDQQPDYKSMIAAPLQCVRVLRIRFGLKVCGALRGRFINPYLLASSRIVIKVSTITSLLLQVFGLQPCLWSPDRAELIRAI